MIHIAIDGPSGAGKSTVAKEVAKRLNIIYVDTGALYRAIGYYMFVNGISKNNQEEIIASLDNITIDIKYTDGVQYVFLNGENLGSKIRLPEVSMYASAVSAIPQVRRFLLETQQSLAKENSVIMDGRDIGTVILPDAEVKIFMTASVEERAMRRYKELLSNGSNVSYNDVLKDMIERDTNDSTRATAPAIPAADAVIFDNSGYTFRQSVEKIIEIIGSKTK